MPLEDLAHQKSRFLKRFGAARDMSAARALALREAVGSAVTKNALFAPKATTSDRYEVDTGWKQLLESYAAKYVKPVSSEEYEQDLVRLTAGMNRHFGAHFRQDRHPKFGYEPGFRVSHAQMSLSLVLKHYWCLGLVAMPPQCPVSRVVLLAARAGELNSKWTDVNSIEAHRIKVKWLFEAAGHEGLELAEWELKTVNAT
ncbi:MAG: hypothetical protein CVT67_05325 [Actinobacteria bacterium HGW-Actinobacteria-7]|jgi:hypothetical protein|nr:MAG: hypothetical protein CVT67_05325 [Actinobacteria bacterium HGW-Actinobacteria-7]